MELRTPVVLIIFRRPDTTQKVFEVIRQVQPSKLFVIADGPRLDKPGEAEKCIAARKIIEQVNWNCQVLTNYSDINLGCKNRVSSGLDWVFSLVEEAIILEDDCVPDPTFFYFCQELLERYRDETRILQILGENTHGYQSTDSSYYFSQYSFYWGWATWRRAWKLYDGSLKLWPQLRETKWLDNLLENERAVQYWSNIFNLVYDGFNSWGWAWSFTCFLHRGLCVGSNVNLISNIGFGVDAAHTNKEFDEIANIPLESVSFPLKHPNQWVRDLEADRVIDHYRFSGRQYFRGLRKQALEKLNTGNNTEALQLLEDCIAFRPDQVGLYYGKAVSLARLGRIHDAITALKFLIDIIPHHQKANVLLGEIRGNLLSISSENPGQERLLYRCVSLEDVVTVCSSIPEINFSNKQSVGQNWGQEDYWDNLWIFNNGSNQNLKAICLVRNPIEVNILGFFNKIEKHYPGLTKMQINEININDIIDKFLSFEPTFYLTEFEKRFRDWFEFDIYDISFSALGWQTYLHKKYHILVMQVELPDFEKENVIKTFFSRNRFEFTNHNFRGEKWYHKRYLELKNKLILSREYLNQCLLSQYAKHFYTEEQRESFYQLYQFQSLI